MKCSLPDAPSSTCRIFHVPSKGVLVGGTHGYLCRYDLATQRIVGQYRGHSGDVWGVSASDSGRMLVTTSTSSQGAKGGAASFRVWDVDDDSISQQAIESLSASCCCCVKGKDLVILGLDDGSLEIRDLRNIGQRIGDRIHFHRRSVSDIVRIGRDSFVSVSTDGFIALWRLTAQGLRTPVRTRQLPSDIQGACVWGYLEDSAVKVPDRRWENEEETLKSVVSVAEEELVFSTEESRDSEEEEEEIEEEEEEAGSDEDFASVRRPDLRSQTFGAVTKNRDGTDFRISSLEVERDQLAHRCRCLTETLTQKEAEHQAVMQKLEDRSRLNSSLTDKLLRAKNELRRIQQELVSVGCEKERISERVRVLEEDNSRLIARIESGHRKRELAPSHIEDALARMTREDRFRLDLSYALEERGFLGYEDRLWDRDRGRILRFRSDLALDVEGSRVPEVVVVDVDNDPTLAKLLSHFLTGEFANKFLELYEDWEETYCEITPDSIAIARARLSSMIDVVRSIAVSISSSFGGMNLDLVRKGCVSRIEQSRGRILLGSLLEAGLPRHRSLCLKLVLDGCRIPCRLENGRYHGVHCLWNVVGVGDRVVVVDMSRGDLIVEYNEDYVAGDRHQVSTDAHRYDLRSFERAYSATTARLPSVGRGTFGEVFAFPAGPGSDEKLAVKEVDLVDVQSRHSIDYRSYLMKEVRLLQTLDHPNVLKLLSTFSMNREIPFSGGFGIASGVVCRRVRCLVMKKYDGSAARLIPILRTLRSEVHPTRLLSEVLLLLVHVVRGLRYLHSLSLVHLDLKPANVLVCWNAEKNELTEVVLCDFAGAKELVDTFLETTVMHTQDYSAPEVKRKDAFDARADIFSFGCFLLAFSEFFDRFSDVRTLGHRCKSVDPSSRPSLLEILCVLKEHLLVLNEEEGMTD